jgi:Na+-translocating ferredoxin:NAD+ oxidoreductase RnfG subunit
MWVQDSQAIRYLTREQALKTAFPGADSITEEKKVIAGTDLENIKRKLKGRLVAWDRAATKDATPERVEYSFFFPVKNNQKTAVAVVEEQPGKWGPMEFLVVLSMDGSVQNILMMSHEETKARPICRRAFFKQFFNKTAKDPLQIGRDVYAVTGATVSSDAVAFAVKKVAVMYEELFLKK